MYDPYADFVKTILPNGLEVHSQFWEGRPWIAVEIVVHSGAREDPAELPGLTHFEEHVVSRNIPGMEYGQVKEFFEKCGGNVSLGNTSYLSTRYSFCIPSDPEILREALRIFGSMVQDAQIEKDIDGQRKIIYREYKGKYDFEEKLEWLMGIRKALFEGHRLGTYNRPLGRKEGFLFATKEHLQNHYDKHYVPQNISLVIVGGLPTNDLISELERSPFARKKTGNRSPLLLPLPISQFPVSRERSRTVKMSDILNLKLDQTGYSATWSFPASFPWQARRIFDRMLNKVLFEEIREKRELAYGIGTNYFYAQDVCQYEISGQVDPEATSSIDEIVQNCVLMVPSRRDLFDRMLTSSIKKCSMVDLSGENLADSAAKNLEEDHRIITTQEEWDELQTVRFEHMAEAVALLSPERKYTFIAHP